MYVWFVCKIHKKGFLSYEKEMSQSTRDYNTRHMVNIEIDNIKKSIERYLRKICTEHVKESGNDKTYINEFLQVESIAKEQITNTLQAQGTKTNYKDILMLSIS